MDSYAKHVRWIQAGPFKMREKDQRKAWLYVVALSKTKRSLLPKREKKWPLATHRRLCQQSRNCRLSQTVCPSGRVALNPYGIYCEGNSRLITPDNQIKSTGLIPIICYLSSRVSALHYSYLKHSIP